MFQVGDRIEIDRSHGRKVTAVISEVQFRNETYIAKVRRDDTGQDDVFVWNIYQDEISVRKIGVVLTTEQFDGLMREKYGEGFRAGMASARERSDW